LLLIQCRERPERYGEPSRFDTMPSEAKLTRLATAKLVNVIGGYGYRPALIIHAGVFDAACRGGRIPPEGSPQQPACSPAS
jgi:hypothetical protein